jgi:hypothetical protein
MSSIPVARRYRAGVGICFNGRDESWTIGNSGHRYSGAIVKFTDKQKSPIVMIFSKEDVE